MPARRSAPLFHPRKTQPFADSLRPVQDALGICNDELMALRAYRALAPAQPQAWFAVGWLSARREPNALACQRAVEDGARVGPFWQ